MNSHVNCYRYRSKLWKGADFGDSEVKMEALPPGPGPFGSKGMAEGGLAPVAPAIAAALRQAVGVVAHDLPMSPERVYRLMSSAD